MLFMKISTITRGTCLIRGYEKFFPIKSLDVGAKSAIEDDDDKGGGPKLDFVVKRNDPEEVKVDRRVDAVTPYLMTQTIKSRTSNQSLFCTIDVSFGHVRDRDKPTGTTADIKAYCMLRFGKARLVSWSLSGADDSARPEESFTFKYSQIALYVRTTEDGVFYTSEVSQSWDFETNKDCPELIPPNWS